MKQTRSALGRGLASLISSKPVPIIPPAANSEVSSSRHSSNGVSSNVVSSESYDGSAAIDHSQSLPTSAATAVAKPVAKHGETSSITEGVRYLNVSELIANPNQPRKDFDETELKELSDSIKTLGVLQPILVRAQTTDAEPEKARGYEIVAGERRFRAAQRAGLKQVPVIIRHLSEREVVEIALVENVQRADLSPLEEAHGYNRLCEEFGLTQREIAERVGKDRATIANFLRLLALPPLVLEMMRKGDITMGHAKAIMTVREPAVQINLAKKIVAEGLSVRAIEAIVSRSVVLPHPSAKSKEPPKQLGTITPEVAAIIDRLRSRLGTKVSVSHHVTGKGKIEIEYFSVSELERLIELIGG